MSASWGAPSRPPTLERAEGMLKERAREKLLSHAGTIRGSMMDAADSHGQMRADDVAACLSSLGLDAQRPPIATIVDAHTTARGLVSCRPLLDEILGAPIQPAPRATRQPPREAPELAQTAPAPQPRARQLRGQTTQETYRYTGRQDRGGFSASPLQRLRQKWRAAAYQNGRMDIARLFRYYDRDNSGELDFNEFRIAARKDAKLTKQEVSDAGLRKLFDRVDIDKGGTIGLNEFQQLLEGDMSPREEARGTDPKAGSAQAEASQHGKGSSGGSTAAKRQRQPSAGLQVLVRLRNFPTERVLKALRKFDPDETGEVPVEAFVSVCKTVGLSTDQISVLLKEYPRTELSSGRGRTVKYQEFIQHLITPLGEVQAQEQLQTMLKLAQQPPYALPPPSGSLSSEQGDREPERAPSVSTAGATMAESENSRRLLEQIHGLSEDERTLSLELWKRCEELEQEVKASRRQLAEGGEDMVAESQQLMRQMREYQQQCKRETGESLTMVVESRRMLSLVTKEKEQVSQERDALATELADLKLQLAKATVRMRERPCFSVAMPIALAREESTRVCDPRRCAIADM